MTFKIKNRWRNVTMRHQYQTANDSIFIGGLCLLWTKSQKVKIIRIWQINYRKLYTKRRRVEVMWVLSRMEMRPLQRLGQPFQGINWIMFCISICDLWFVIVSMITRNSCIWRGHCIYTRYEYCFTRTWRVQCITSFRLDKINLLDHFGKNGHLFLWYQAKLADNLFPFLKNGILNNCITWLEHKWLTCYWGAFKHELNRTKYV